MEQLHHIGLIVQLFQGRNLRRVKFSAPIGGRHRGIYLRNGEVLQILSEDDRRPLAIVHGCQVGQFFFGDRRKHGGHIQSAVGRQAIENGLGSRHAGSAAGGEKRHISSRSEIIQWR